MIGMRRPPAAALPGVDGRTARSLATSVVLTRERIELARPGLTLRVRALLGIEGVDPSVAVRLAAMSAILTVILVASQVPGFLQFLARPDLNGYGGVDYRLYMDATQHWLGGGAFYQPYQLAGPYPISAGDILYPPVDLWLFAPFVVLPPAVWWLVPLGATAWVVWRMRPAAMAWPIIALCVLWPPTIVKIATGNPVMWVVAAVALGCLYRWSFMLVLIKPSLFPFSLIGMTRRSSWLTLGIIVLLSLPFGAMWIDWIGAVANSRGGGFAYSIQEVPMLLVPVVAWVWRTGPARLGRPVRRGR